VPIGRRRDELPTTDLSRDELAALLTAARSVNEATDLDAALNIILDEAIKLLGGDEGSVMLFDVDRAAMTIRVSRGLDPAVVAASRVLPGQGISGYVAQSGRPLLLASDEAVRRYANPLEARSIRSAVSVPLRDRGTVEGVLNVNLRGDGDGRSGFTERELELATLFAEHAATTVHNSTSYGQARQRGDELALLFDASRLLSEAVTVEDVSARVLDTSTELLDGRGGFVVVLGEDQAGPEVSLARSVARGRVIAALRRDQFAELLAGGIQFVSGLSEHPVLAPLASPGSPDDAVVVPLRSERTPCGLVVSLIVHPPDDGAMRILANYASQAGVALAKAVLLRGMRAKQAELASLVHAVPDPMIVVDHDGRFVSINPAAAERFGLNPQFELGLPYQGRLRSTELEGLLSDPHGGRMEVTLYTPSPHTYRARVTSANPQHGMPGARILILDDVTSEKDSEQTKADFLAVIGHELRTPLTLIKGYASTLARRGEELDPDVRAKALDAIAAHSHRLERLIADLLFVSNIERTQPPLALIQADLVAVVADELDAMRRENPRREIELRSNVDSLDVLIDNVKLEQVLHHLVDNALKFSEAPDPVEVAIEASDFDVEVAVSDRGIGIFTGHLPTLFERFHQLDGTSTRAHGGTGVGLYICKALVEAHGGHIGVTSALGRGSTFTVRLPLLPLGWTAEPEDETESGDAAGAPSS